MSGSRSAAVGQWIAPDGTDLTTVQNDSFEVVFGDSNNPGQLMVEAPLSSPPVTAIHEGVYTCAIPDETGEINYVFIGIYLEGFSGK